MSHLIVVDLGHLHGPGNALLSQQLLLVHRIPNLTKDYDEILLESSRDEL